MIAVLEVEEEPIEVVISDSIPLLDSEDGENWWLEDAQVYSTNYAWIFKQNKLVLMFNVVYKFCQVN